MNAAAGDDGPWVLTDLASDFDPTNQLRVKVLSVIPPCVLPNNECML